MYDVEDLSTVLANATDFARWDAYTYIQSQKKMAALGYVYTLGNKLCISPNAVWVEMPPMVNFLRFRYLHASSCMTGTRRCPVSSARSAQNSVGRRKRIRIWKDENGVTATTTLFPHTNSWLYLGTLSHFAPWNKLIHGLELFQFAAISPVLPMHANTLDKCRQLEPRTFLNRHHYPDVWYAVLA